MPMQWQWWNTSHSHEFLFLHYPRQWLPPPQSPTALRYCHSCLQTSLYNLGWTCRVPCCDGLEPSNLLADANIIFYVHDSEPECRPSTLPLQITDQPLPLHFFILKSLTSLLITKNRCSCSRDTTNPIVSLPLISNDFEDGARSRQHPIVDTLTAAMELSILSRLYRGAYNEEDQQIFLLRVFFSENSLYLSGITWKVWWK